MPALHFHVLQKRLESGTTFSIIFGVIAAVVIVACAIWGIAIPEYRRNRPPSPAAVKWNTGSILTTRTRSKLRRTYPNHPAVRPLLSKPSAAQIVSTYNPRTESPFPDGPAISMTSFCRGGKARANSSPLLPTSISSNGLFTPIKRSDSRDDDSKSKYHTVPRVNDAKHLAAPSSDFGDAKDFILAVPEPLALRPREAGRPPAVTRHLQRYGTPLTDSPAASDKHLHPNKLFRAVQKADLRNSFCSSTSMRIDHRQSDAAKNLSTKDIVEIEDEAIQEEPVEMSCEPNTDNRSNKEAPASEYNSADDQNRDLAISTLR